MSSSSSASSSRSSSPEPAKIKTLKRKRKEEIDLISDSDGSDAESDSETDSTAEEPVLSHAERRKRKKEERLKEKLRKQPGSLSKKIKLKDGAAAAPSGNGLPKRQNSVWVGNMSFKTTQENLRTFFSGVGEVTRINMPTKPVARPGGAPENRGFAYVDFETSEAKAAAIALSEKPLVGRKLLIKDGGDFSGRPIVPGVDVKTNDSALAQKSHSKTAQKILRAQKQPPAPTLFIGNLPFETTEDDIRGLFQVHRTTKIKDEKEDKETKDKPKKNEWIRKVRMGTFEDTGACKGFAFVDFTSIDNATSTLINPKTHHLNGRNLVVEYAGPDAVRRGAVKDKSTPGGTSNNTRSHSSAGHRPNRKNGDFSASSSPHKVENYNSNSSAKAEIPSGDSEVPTKEKEIIDQSESEPPNPSSSKYVRGGRGGERERDGIRQKGPRTRPKPGAALALAKRETAAIVPSQGKKITF